jgi:hypothetical protein
VCTLARPVPIASLNEVNHLAALRLLTNANEGAFTTSQLQAQAMLFLDMRQNGILVTLVFWGLWLLPLGFLVFKSGFLPRVLGVLLVIAAAGHVTDVATQLLSPGIPTIGQFTFVGEILFTLWLLIKGIAYTFTCFRANWPRAPSTRPSTTAVWSRG